MEKREVLKNVMIMGGEQKFQIKIFNDYLGETRQVNKLNCCEPEE